MTFMRPRHRVPHQCREPDYVSPLARQDRVLPRARRPRRAHRFHVYQGYTIPPHYDSLIGKLIVHGKTRQECLMRLRRALDEYVVDGIETTLPLFRALVREEDMINGDYHIHWLEEFLAKGGMG